MTGVLHLGQCFVVVIFSYICLICGSVQRSTKDFDVISETKCNNTVVAKRQTAAGEKTVEMAVKNDGPAFDLSMCLMT